MKKLNLFLMAMAGAVALAACDDSGQSLSKPGDAGCEGFGCGGSDAGGGSGGGGGAGGEEPGEACLGDDDCPASQYCDKSGGGLEGECRDGCREGGCAAGQECNLDDHSCRCTSDEACEVGTFCNLDTGLCDTGCRPDDPSSCPEGTCNPDTRECESAPEQHVCCSGDDGSTCGLAPDAASCQGTFIERLASCEPTNPCGPACASDEECAADRYCSQDGTCLLGCRGEPNDTCPDGQHCDVEKRSCEPDEPPMGCQTDAECPADQFCDVNTGECEPGCRLDAEGACPPGENCDPASRECVPGCDGDDDCAQGEYCNLNLGICQPFCDGHDDCQPDEFCDFAPEGGRCVVGCRDDDNGTNNDIASAMAIVEAGQDHGEVRGSLVCPDNPDFYSVNLAVGARMQADLNFDAGDGDIQMHLYDADGNQLLAADAPGSPKRLRYPVAAEGVPAGAPVFIEIVSRDPVSQTYDLAVTVIDVLGGEACFPEASEFDDMGRGHNISDDAIDLGWDGMDDDQFAFRGSICNSDEDWWSFEAPNENVGLSIELVVDGQVGGAVIEVYNSVTVRNLGQPSFVSGPGVAGAGGIFTYSLDVPRDTGAMSADTWFIRLRGQDAASVLDDYGINIELLEDRVDCDEDEAEPNPDLGAAFDLDGVAGVTQNGELLRRQDLELPLDLTLCSRDEDWYRFSTNDGDQVTVWATSDNLAGQATVEITNGLGVTQGAAGEISVEGEATIPASYNGAREGDHFIRVRSVGAGTANPYRLFVHINPTMMCGGDVAEVGPGAMRNDTAGTATVLMSVDDGTERFEVDGLVCNVGGNDRDWYTFGVPAADSRICVSAEFDHAAGDLSVLLFNGVNDPDNDVPCNANGDCSDPMVRASRLCLRPANVCGCMVDNDCDVDGNGLDGNDGLCVNQRCKAPTGRSSTNGAPELVNVPRAEVRDPGSYYALVEGVDGAENSYSLAVTVNQAAMDCHADWREGDPDNNDLARPTYLGAGQAGACDAWLCNDERASGDWYSFDILPDDGDRTVLVTFEGLSDGETISLLVMEGMNGIEFFERQGLANPPPRDSRGECINIRADEMGGRVVLQVSGDAESGGDNDQQIEYTLRILPTNLDLDANGRCDEFVPNLANVWEAEQP